MAETPIRGDGRFHAELIEELDGFFVQQANRFPRDEVLRMDMHCHDFNSDKPTELLGRILKLPETWLPTDKLLETLARHGCDARTITNHNNARSIWPLKEAGLDILSAAEFTCTVPEFGTYIHVLTYGFGPEQEDILNKLRYDVYEFQAYTRREEIPTVWAHPLYYYTPNGVPPFEFFKKMALIFERFEVINGQRDTWQNMLVKCWVEGLTPDRIDAYSKEMKVDSHRFCRDPYAKHMVGGSDSHMGIFCGLTGSYLHVPDLARRRGTESIADLAREALLEGRVAPFGSHNNYEKLTVALLDYLCQIALHHEDPGLSRILLHKGSVHDKALALLVTNAFGELKRHKVTMNFVKLFHKCFSGRKPNFAKRWFVPAEYKNIFDAATRIAEIRSSDPENMAETFKESISSVHDQLNAIFASRVAGKIEQFTSETNWERIFSNDVFDHFEIPSHVRSYSRSSSHRNGSRNGNGNGNGPVGPDEAFTVPDLSSLFDGLSFPFLASTLILGAHFASTKALYNTRPILSQFADEIGRFSHPERALWLTDTYQDGNGVSMSLRATLREIQRRDLPIDFLVCSSTVEPEDHLIVVPPVSEFTLPIYKQQPFRVPNFLDIHKLFLEGEYDRVVCSTEGPMGLVALYLKHAYTVPAYFYIHTDWIMFARKVLNFDHDNISRLRRFLRAFYRNFDGIFVLNSDQRKWLCSKDMGFSPQQVHLTAHWVQDTFHRKNASRESVFGLPPDTPVMLFAGRISHEKGIGELPEILDSVRAAIPAVKLVVVGKGPAEEELRRSLPDAIHMGWVDHEQMPEIYSACDLFLMPSRFDTFGNVVLEAMSCGCPAVAYKTKGPKDIIEHDRNGYVVTSRRELINKAIQYLGDPELHGSFRVSAQRRVREGYSVDDILDRLGADIGLELRGKEPGKKTDKKIRQASRIKNN